MRKIEQLIPLLAAIALTWPYAPGEAKAAQICVNPSGTGGCFASIQDAIDAAADGDEITIAAGTYNQGFGVTSKRLSLVGAGADSTFVQGGVGIAGFFARPVVTISGMRIENGDGVRLSGATVSLDHCVIAGHSEPGLWVQAGGATGTRRSNVTMTDCAVTGNPLGIYGIISRLTLRRSAIFGNGPSPVREGGIHLIDAQLTLEDSTVSGNHADVAGGGIRILSGGRMKVRGSTIAANDAVVEGGNVSIAPDGYMSIQSTILGDGSAPVGADCATTGSSRRRIASRGFNRIESIDGCEIRLLPTDSSGQDPMLGPLLDNGGPTPTHALLAGSPALAAISAGKLCRNPDQRGVARAVPCDVGAFEAP